MVDGLGCRIFGLPFRAQGFGFRGLGFRGTEHLSYNQ